jgi:hypothetical protein
MVISVARRFRALLPPTSYAYIRIDRGGGVHRDGPLPALGLRRRGDDRRFRGRGPQSHGRTVRHDGRTLLHVLPRPVRRRHFRRRHGDERSHARLRGRERLLRGVQQGLPRRGPHGTHQDIQRDQVRGRLRRPRPPQRQPVRVPVLRHARRACRPTKCPAASVWSSA